MEYLPKILEYVLIIILGILANKAKGIMNNNVKRAIVKDTVLYVEQIFKDLHGRDKLMVAEEKAIKLLNQKGIKISQDELTVLIESVVAEINQGNGNIAIDDLAKIIMEPADDYDECVECGDGDS